jgi:NAD+ synthase
MLRPVLKDDAQTVISWFLRHHVTESGIEGVVVGMSGGLDSSVVAKLAVDGLGPDKVTAVLMPEASTPDECMEDAEAMADEWGVEVLSVNILEAVEVFGEMMACDTREDLGNVKSRLRMMTLYHIARLRGLLVLGTGNKSELLTGYFTKWGDGASDLCPVGDLYKSQVKVLAGKIGIPEKVIDRVPSGNLWDGQTDEDELGIDYGTLDRILLGIELGMGDQDIVKSAEVTTEQVNHVRKLVKGSVHKRRLGLIPKLGARTVGLDWREADLR